MNALLRLLACFSIFTAVSGANAGETNPFSFPRATPESQGVSSAAVLALVPACLFFAFIQRYLVQGLTAGAIKG